jgi:hypothetical protein
MKLNGNASLIARILILGILISCLGLLSIKRINTSNASGQKASVPAVSVQQQPDTPLRINLLSTDPFDQRDPEIVYEITNVSAKPVRAYNISQVTLRGTQDSRGMLLTNLELSNVVLRPGQYFTESITFQPSADTPSQVTLSVDFVEFADGTTWGPNLYKADEMVAGQRAGAREAKKRIQKAYKSEGVKAALNLVETDPVGATPLPEAAQNWEAGYHRGYSATLRRLKALLKEGQINKVEAELRRLPDK